ncbi:MAG: NAD(P)H-binding protein [Thermoplasmata archaeon]
MTGLRVLVVGGTGGLVGRALRAEFAEDWAIRSVHRRPVPAERDGPGTVEWIRADATAVRDWGPLLDGVEGVVTLAWLREGRSRQFGPLADSLVRLIRAAEAAGPSWFLHLSVPQAPRPLETGLPYLTEKRRVDRALEASRLPYLILRPTLLFGPGDRLLTVMLRLMHRYGIFPMFGDGHFHVSPLASRDLARIARRELGGPPRRNLLLGGPRRWEYRELTDRLFAALGRRPRYGPLGPRGSARIARTMERLGLRTIYEYEVLWLLSDMLGLPPYVGLNAPLEEVGPFLDREAARLMGGGVG